RSSRRLEAECQRNVEVMWLLGRLQPDYKSIAEFRRMHSQAVTEAGAELVRLARSVGLVKGDTVAVDGSKFRAVSSAKSVREREAMKRYLEQLDAADEQAEACEAQGIVPHVRVTRAVNNQGDGTLFDRNEFHYDEKTDTFRCPANQTLTRKQLSRKDRAVYYAAKPEVCGACALKMRC